MSTFLGVEQATPGANPSATEDLYYFKSDGLLYVLNSAGLERQIVSGQGSPSGALMQYMFVQFGGL